MKRKFSAGKVLLVIVLGAAAITAITFVIMTLWNRVLVEVVSVNPVSFWQAMGIFALSKILFGFGGGRGHGGHPFWWNREIRQKMRNMNEEEREKFKEEMCRRMSFWHRGEETNFSSSHKKTESFNNNPADESK